MVWLFLIALTSLWYPHFNSFGRIPRSGIAGSYASSVFNFLRNLHTVCHSSCIILPFPPKSVFQFPHNLTGPYCPLLFDCFWPWSFLAVYPSLAVRWHLSVVLICITLLISDLKHLFIHLLAIWTSPLEKSLFRSFLFLQVDYYFYFFSIELYFLRHFRN